MATELGRVASDRDGHKRSQSSLSSPSGDHPSRKACKTCFGTGQVLCLRSHFYADGFRRERCGICSGSGLSTYRDSPDYIRFQREARVADEALRRASKGLDDRALGYIAREAIANAADQARGEQVSHD